MSRRFPDPWRTLPAAPFVSRFVMVILAVGAFAALACVLH
jgi:hypothetical protein